MTRRAGLWTAAFLIAVAVADVTARGGRGGGGRGGGRMGGGFARGGAAAGGSFGYRGAAGGGYGGGYSARGPAASGRFPGRRDYAGEGTGDWRGERQERVEARRDERQERRDDWQEYAENRREDWQDYAEDHYDDHVYYDDDYYYPHGAVAVGAEVAEVVAAPADWSLPCTPATVVVGGTTYYRCESAWYVRVYSGGDVAYTMVNPPAGYD